MKVGAENKKKVVVAVVLLVVAAGLFLHTMSSSGRGPGTEATAPALGTNSKPVSRSSSSRDAHARHIAYRLQPTLDPELRLDLLKESEGMKYQGSGRNIFSEHLEEIPKPVAPGRTDKAGTKPEAPPWKPAQPPGPPPINLKFYGWASEPGEPRAVFLSQGDSVFVAHEGDIIARRYKVMRITPNAVEIQDVLSNNTQSIPLVQS
jgi:hypothetical protein